MSHHGCPERLSNRSKNFQEESAGQATMEVLVETLTGTAFEMTVSPSDTILAIKAKIFRVEGIPVSQQHLVYNLKELEDGASLRALGIGDGARLRLVLGMRGGPISTRRLPPPPSDISGELERLLGASSNRYRESTGWGGGGSRSGCKVTVLVFRDGERVNMLRVRENRDGSLQPLDHAKYSSPAAEAPAEGAGAGAGARDNAVTHRKMQELRRRMQALAVRRPNNAPLPELQKTRSEETLCAPPAPLYAATLDYDVDRVALLPPIVSGSRAESSQSVERAGRGAGALGLLRAPAHGLAPDLLPPIGGLSRAGARAFGSSSALWGGRALCVVRAGLGAALLSASTSHLEALRRSAAPLARHRVREHLHLSDERLEAAPAAPAPAPAPARLRCALCRRRLSVAAAHTCRCGAAFCAPHRYAEAHHCAAHNPDKPAF